MKNKVVSIDEALSHIKSGMDVMISGFAAVGSPNNLSMAMSKLPLENMGIVCNDFGACDHGFEQGANCLLDTDMVKRAIVSFLGTSPKAVKRGQEGLATYEFVPMGIFAERIRAAGAGLGGIYSPVGVGTLVAEGKETRVIDGKEYILEKPIHADVALVKAFRADTFGNAVCLYTATNFNVAMAMAADFVILEAEEVVDVGEIHPNAVTIPGVFVDCVVECKEVLV